MGRSKITVFRLRYWQRKKLYSGKILLTSGTFCTWVHQSPSRLGLQYISSLPYRHQTPEVTYQLTVPLTLQSESFLISALTSFQLLQFLLFLKPKNIHLFYFRTNYSFPIVIWKKALSPFYHKKHFLSKYFLW